MSAVLAIPYMTIKKEQSRVALIGLAVFVAMGLKQKKKFLGAVVI